MSAAIQLIVGLGNPGKSYAETRHNAGAWYVDALAAQHQQTLRLESKFHGAFARIEEGGQTCYLFIPSTYMNESGRAVKAIAKFYKIPPEAILIAHDELDLDAGVVRLKQDGGHGGHNGLRDVIAALGSRAFARLRFGIGHPGHRDRVHDYVLNKPSRAEHQSITDAIDTSLTITPQLLSGDIQNATQQLHTI